MLHVSVAKSLDRKSLNSPLGCIQLTYTKSIDMLNKNTPGARPKLFISNNVKSITYKFQKVQSLTLDVQQFEHN